MIHVASYCRVSTNKEDQANSFEAQQRFFREYIQWHDDWSLYDVYADEGITGTSTKKRVQFNRMIQDAWEGKFQMIVTKEVSRFSRNILDTIAYTRELKSIGIGVLFVTDGINTLDPDAELYLSIMASIAQEESRKTSARVVWGQTRQMERGVVFGHDLLGYDVKNGKITVNPDGADLVRLIFLKYAFEQKSTAEIARYLTEKGYRTSTGSANWKSNTVNKILKNEKYAGDLVQKKTYTPDFLTHEKHSNKGAVPRIIIQNHHEPIVSRELWEMTQLKLQRNNKHSAGDWGHSNRYVFSGKIKCGECGNRFVGRIKYLKDGSKIRRWSCATAVKEGATVCDIGKLIRDDDALQILKTAIRNLSLDIDAISKHVARIALSAVQTEHPQLKNDPERLQREIDRIYAKKDSMMDAFFSCEITKEDMQRMTQKYDQQLFHLKNQIDASVKGKEQTDTAHSEIYAQITSILKGETESEVFYKTILDSLTVFKDRHMELRLNSLQQVFVFEG